MFFETRDGSKIAHELTGLPLEGSAPLIVWGHGWGQSRRAFASMAATLANRASQLLIDFPGFGESPPPASAWGTAEYADAVAALLEPYRQGRKVIWVGHSFGGRVGIQLAARHGGLVDGLFLVGSHGLPRRRGLWGTLKIGAKIYVFKALKRVWTALGLPIEGLRDKFGSADYKAAGNLREVFQKVIREDLTAEAQQVQCPVQLVYGERDTETPPEIGERLARLMPQAALTILPGQDHYTVLGEGRYPVMQKLAAFLESA